MPDDEMQPANQHRTRVLFTPREDDWLRELWGQGVPGRQIASIMGRPPQSVHDRAAKLGLRKRPPPERRDTTTTSRAEPSWPAEARYDDDPRAPAWEPRFRQQTPPTLSATATTAQDAVMAGDRGW